MDISGVKSKMLTWCRKYKYSILVLLIGLLLMAIPGRTNRKYETVTNVKTETSVQSLETRLSAILSQVNGAGRVEVVLSASAGEEVIYQTNHDSSSGGSGEHDKSNTVTITDADRNQAGLIKQVNPEQYMGAIVLCQGADNPVVCLAIVDAVSKATGLGANKISVLKMK